ncbi:MAG: thioesterase family protein [Desulfobacterales bacterium]|nr:thioesterase family protein [Desulfobacterales bacterium]
MNPFAPEKREPVRYNWIRAIDRMPDDPAIHQYLLAYASDYGLVVTSLYPHGQSFWQPAMQVASLDHVMWFHRPLLAIGKIYDRRGSLVATMGQEGLIRFRSQLA